MYKTTKICAATALIAILPVSGHAETMGNKTSQLPALQNFTSHNLVTQESYSDYVQQMTPERKLELRAFMDYEQREPCQSYQPVPAGFVRDGCKIRPEREVRLSRVEYKTPEAMQPAAGTVMHDYKVYFSFDSAEIRAGERATIERVANEISRYNPREVTISGHADRAGPQSYNHDLSKRRAQAVSEALTQRGVANRVLEKKAYGEMRPAIETGDGVTLEENRRVVIEFRS